MILSFALSMPSNNAWNGKWSGDESFYAIVRNVRTQAKAQIILDGKRYTYNFGDGWCAAVTVREVDAKEARQIRNKSQGFCGYDWMVDSIFRSGKIEAG